MHKRSTKTDRSTFGFSRGVAAIAAAFLVAPVPAAAEPLEDAEAMMQREVNPALRYWAAWAEGREQLHAFEEASAAEPFGLDDPDWAPDPRLAGSLDDLACFIELLIEASAGPAGDFGVDYSKGLGLTMPHIRPLIMSARVIRADARRSADDGRIDEAIERIAAIYRMSLQFTDERVLISAFVRVEMDRAASAEAVRLAERHELNAAQRTRLLAAIDRAPAADRLGVRQTLRSEPEIFRSWVLSRFPGESAGRDLARELGGNGLWLSIPIAHMNAQQLTDDMRGYQRYFDRAIELWDRDGAAKSIRLVENEVGGGEFGAVAASLAPSLFRLRVAETGADELRNRARSLLGAAERDPVEDF
ncbi:MAG: hypothetical protein JJU33_06385 [Phycisphaerales bacterium]|nr:hypothetical protein [Phycisphaerales bacterium]